MHNTKIIASLITDNIAISSEYLLQQFLAEHEDIHYDSFCAFCAGYGIIIEGHEFLDLLKSDQTHIFHEYSDADGCYWVPSIFEGYMNNTLPGDWDDFGDDEIEGITGPVYGALTQPEVINFEPLTDEEEEEEENVSDLPDFDTTERRRPSRHPTEIENTVGDGGILLETNTSMSEA